MRSHTIFFIHGAPHVSRANNNENHTDESNVLLRTASCRVVKCGYRVLKDIAATDGLKVLSMYAKSLEYGMSTAVEKKSAVVEFAMIWAVQMLNSVGLSDVIRQCDAL